MFASRFLSVMQSEIRCRRSWMKWNVADEECFIVIVSVDAKRLIKWRELIAKVQANRSFLWLSRL